jgi:hypothetical protein
MLADGSRLVVPVGSGPATVSPAVPVSADASQPRLTESLLEILQVLREAAPTECLTATEIASRVGCEPHSRFRARVAELVRLGLIASLKPGYVLTDAGRDVPTGI